MTSASFKFNTEAPEPPLSIDDFDEIIGLIKCWQSGNSLQLDQAGSQSLDEILARLDRLKSIAQRLVEINNALTLEFGVQFEFDENTDTLHFKIKGECVQSIKLNRANPALPIKMTNGAFFSAYQPGGKLPDESYHSRMIKIQLEDDLEHFYYGAHRIIKLIQALPKRKNFKCKSIAIVRNKLIDHADHSARYSFGYGTNGLFVRPLGKANRLWVDAGFQINAREFLGAIASEFQS